MGRTGSPRTHETDLLRRAGSRDHAAWLAHTASTRGCVRPVRLTGHLHTIERATGAILESRHTGAMPDGVLYVPCGDRRASVCQACAETYRADTFQLIKAGLVGGKGVPESVASHPAVFLTTTAPSFGPVHTRRLNRSTGKVAPCRMRRTITRCPHGKPLVCTARHREDDPSLGRPICLDCYDHVAHVVWNGWAGELWRRTMISLNRRLRSLEDPTTGRTLRVSYGKVAEYQRRGVVHFHAIIRLDATSLDDPDVIYPPPHWINVDQFAEYVAAAFQEAGFHTPEYADTGHSWLIEWGRQLDVRSLGGITDGQITSDAVAAYLAKYATKATETTGLPCTKRLNGETAEYYSNSATHLGRLVAYAWQLGGRPADWTTDEQQQRWHDTYGRLRRWTHMLGFGGHFSTKSRRYSTTHKALRAARRIWQRRQTCEWRRSHGLDAHDDETTLVIADLTLAGIGWHTTADAALATQAAARAREHRQLAKQERQSA